jgi:hypothetical protein
VIPSWESGGEERKEVSTTMRRLRQKYDNTHKTVLAKEKELAILRKRLELVKADEAEALDGESKKGQDLQGTQDVVQKVTKKHDFELMLQRQYKHMIHRMQQDIIAE